MEKKIKKKTRFDTTYTENDECRTEILTQQ